MSEVWQEVVDKTSGKSYYYNKSTRETSWSKPASFIPAKNKPSSAATGSTSGNPSGSTSGNTSGGTAGGTKGSSKTGGTGGTSGSTSGKASSSDLPPGWVASIDPSSGKKYYYNRKTRETRWTPPVDDGEDGGGEGPSGDAGGSNSTRPKKAGNTTTGGTTGGGSTKGSTGSTASKGSKRQRTGVVSPDGQWEEVVDPTSGQKYWYNTTTKATAWKLPASAELPLSNGGGGSAAPVAKPAAAANPVEQKEETFERPSDRMMKLKQALHTSAHEEIAVQQTAAVEKGQNPDELDDEDDEDSFDLQFAKHRKGWINRTFRLGKAHDEQQLLTFKKSLIKKALLKKNRDLDEECIQAFKNIMSYMGDRKSTRHPEPDHHARKLIANAMSKPAGLRDEVYLLLVKQTTDNPSVSSLIKGWELFIFCLASYPPSKSLKKFLKKYFEENRDNAEEETVKKHAEDCLDRLDKIIMMGQRKEVPSKLELDNLRTHKPIPIRVTMIDGTFKTIMADSYMTAREVEQQLTAKLNLSLSSPFALYQAHDETPNVERQLEPKDRVMDTYASWQDDQMVAGDPTEQKQKEKSPFNRFLFKAKLVLKTSNPDVMADPEAVNLLYIQAIHAIVTYRYPVKEKDITVLAALQLQSTFGDYQAESHGPGWLAPKLLQYMPRHLLTDKKGKISDQLCNDWEQKILEKYSKIQGFTSLEAKLNYLDYVQEWPFYGATFYEVEQRQFKDYPSPITLGITSEGVIIMHPQKRSLLENYPYTDIVTWGSSSDRFIVVVGNIVQQRKLIFKTPDGKQSNDLIHDYVRFKVKNRVAK